MGTVFYSWQIDTPTDTGRNLIERALQDAIKSLNSDADVEEAERDEVRLDKDTLGVSGSPPIMQTIFRKIDAATAFVADLTFVGKREDGRLMPNPNVTIEYGWALKSLDYGGVIGVMNVAHGNLKDHSLPFDLGHLRRPIIYDCPVDATEEVRKKARRDLAAILKHALNERFESLPKASAAAPPQFVPREPLDGRARFRTPVEPLGRPHSGLPLIADGEPTRVFLQHGAAMWLRVTPTVALKEELLSTNIQGAMLAPGVRAIPLNYENEPFSPQGVRGHDGFGLCQRIHDEHTRSVVYGFLTGEVWTIDTLRLAAAVHEVIFEEKAYVLALQSCASILNRLGIAGPYRWIAGMEGVRDRCIVIAARSATFPKPAAVSNVVERQGTFSGEKADAAAALEPFFAAVYDNHQLRRPGV